MNIPCIADLDVSVDDAALISQFIMSDKYGGGRRAILAGVIRLFVQRHMEAAASDKPYTAISIDVKLITELLAGPRNGELCLSK